MYDDNEYLNNRHFDKNYVYIIIGIIVIILLFFLIKIFSKKSMIKLVGGDITLTINQNYVEPGYSYIDEDGNDLTRFVEVTNNINIKVPGTYEVIYRYGNDENKRKVKVLKPKNYKLSIEYSLSNEKYTNEDIIIYYKVNGESFEKLMLPNGNIINNREGSYTVSENGNYKLTAYNISNDSIDEIININNIDKEKPTGRCIATLTNLNTEINVEALDNIKIDKYEYIDNDKIMISNNENKYIHNSKTSKEIYVKVYDTAGNVNNLKCELIDNSYYEPILPNIGENVVFKGETDTLKAYIINNNSYYLTRIWAKNPYLQLNKAASNEYGRRMYKPVSLLQNEVINSNLKDKLIIGFNASGFYLKDTFDAASVDKYPAYDRTSVGTIVINNGQLIRNSYNYAVKDWYIMGINKDNKMVIFEDKKTGSSYDIASKQSWAQEVINSGIRNTFSFAGPVILNGQRLTSFSPSMPDSDNNSVKKLQLICQINDNNFAIFTSKEEVRKKAIDVFESIGCQTATNLDGGASIALLYKEKNSSEFKTIIGGGREMPEVGYFTE